MEGTIADILQAAGAEGNLPSEDLLPLVYEELRGLAAARMNGRSDYQTLQPTALVHEAWVRLAGRNERSWNDRAHFFRAAAQTMRCILVDRARAKSRIKRDHSRERMDLDDLDLVRANQEERILLVHETLERMEREDPESARIVTLKFFGGLTNQEIARADGVTERTVERKWAYAKTSLFQMMQQHG
jgi:RNA polymerase sigma factor (TIGR02999 family)